jgi:hypothetical protein
VVLPGKAADQIHQSPRHVIARLYRRRFAKGAEEITVIRLWRGEFAGTVCTARSCVETRV